MSHTCCLTALPQIVLKLFPCPLRASCPSTIVLLRTRALAPPRTVAALHHIADDKADRLVLSRKSQVCSSWHAAWLRGHGAVADRQGVV